MGSIISKIADEIELHGSYEEYCAWRDRPGDIPEAADKLVVVFDNGHQIEGFYIDEVKLLDEFCKKK